MGQQLFDQHQLGTGLQLGVGVAHGGGDAADLAQLHFAEGALFHLHVGDRVQDALAVAGSFAIMLFHVLHPAVLANVEGVDAVVLGRIMGVVVDAAAGNDLHVAVVANVEGVVDHVLQARLGHDHGDVDLFALGAGLDADVDAGVVGLGLDVDERRGAATDQLAVLADVERSGRHAMQAHELLEHGFVNGGKIHCHGCLLSRSWG